MGNKQLQNNSSTYDPQDVLALLEGSWRSPCAGYNYFVSDGIVQYISGGQDKLEIYESRVYMERGTDDERVIISVSRQQVEWELQRHQKDPIVIWERVPAKIMISFDGEKCIRFAVTFNSQEEYAAISVDKVDMLVEEYMREKGFKLDEFSSPIMECHDQRGLSVNCFHEIEGAQFPIVKNFKFVVNGDDPDTRAKIVLAVGAIRLLSSDWLLKRPPGYIIQRRQDLPEEAFLTHEAAVHKLGGIGFQLESVELLLLSYGWLTKEHPDPDGFHLHTVQQYLKTLQKHRPATVGIFWDFASLPQSGMQPASAAEVALRLRGLCVMHRLYGSRNTTVLQLTRMPRSDLKSYVDRGWCFFEATVSSMLKCPQHLLDLGSEDAQLHLNQDDSDCFTITKAAVMQRRPPLVPKEMKIELEKRSFTNGRSDSDLVANLYADFFQEATTNASKLILSNESSGDGWGDMEILQFARALPFFTKCKYLRLENHAFGDMGLCAIAAALPNLTCLSTLWLHGKFFDDKTTYGAEGLSMLSACLPQMPALKELALSLRLEGTPEARALSVAWAAGGRVKKGLCIYTN